MTDETEEISVGPCRKEMRSIKTLSQTRRPLKFFFIFTSSRGLWDTLLSRSVKEVAWTQKIEDTVFLNIVKK